MSTTQVKLSGTTKYMMEDDGYEGGPGSYKVNLYLDKASLKVLASGKGAQKINLKLREDEDGKYIIVRKKHKEGASVTPPVILNPDMTHYIPSVEGLWAAGIGNGTEVTIGLDVYTTKKANGSTLKVIRIDNLVPYVIEEKDDDEMVADYFG